MMGKLFIRTFLCTVLFYLSDGRAFPAHLAGNDAGVYAGYRRSAVQGLYDDYLGAGNYFCTGLLFPIPLLYRHLFAEGEFLAGSHEVTESPSSSFQQYTLRLGATAAWPLFSHFNPYAGLFFQESMVHLDAAKIKEAETALKPGLGIRAGALVPVYSIFGLRLGVEYSNIALSVKHLKELSFTAAATIRIPFFSTAPSGEEMGTHKTGKLFLKDHAEEHFRLGLEMVKKGDADSAEEAFRKTLTVKPDHTGATRMLQEISSAKAGHAKARTLLKAKNYYNAIPHLEKAAAFIGAAGTDLAETRSLLSGELPGLIRRGIRAYEERNYDKCITLMKKVQIVDPENETAKLYLPRAQSRKKAIDRLK